jgi:alpha-L-arabinofuranosidase
VRYCNEPVNEERLRHGSAEPYSVRLWQIGNETSYDPDGFSAEEAAWRTVEFARAMRRADPSIQLIGWGDSGWADTMLDVAGDEIDYVAYHPALAPARGDPESPLRSQEYRTDPASTWDHLMSAYGLVESQLQTMREHVAPYGKPLAVTECHFSLPGRNRCEVLSTWAAGVANARILNLHERNGDVLKIATLADFCGTRWQVNAIMIPSSWQRPYLMPVARVMSLYRRHSGDEAVTVVESPPPLDVAASMSGDTFYLHVVNTNRTQPMTVSLRATGRRIASGRAFEICDAPMREIDEENPDLFQPTEKRVPSSGRWTFPAASVTALEVCTAPVAG